MPKATITPTLEICENLKEFFDKSGLLSKACDETSIEYHTVRRQFQGDVKKISIIYAVVLLEWQRMWEKHEVVMGKHEAERRTLAEKVPQSR